MEYVELFAGVIIIFAIVFSRLIHIKKKIEKENCNLHNVICNSNNENCNLKNENRNLKNENCNLKEALDNYQIGLSRIEDDYKSSLENLNEIYVSQINALEKRMKDDEHIHIKENDFSDIVLSNYYKISQSVKPEYRSILINPIQKKIITESEITGRIETALLEQYRYKFLINLYPNLVLIFDGTKVKDTSRKQSSTLEIRAKSIFDTIDFIESNQSVFTEIYLLKNKIGFYESTMSNLTAIPYMSKLMADFETYELEILAKGLEWGDNQERKKKVKSIRDLRKETSYLLSSYKESQYQLEYLLNLYPGLRDIIESNFNDVYKMNINEIPEYDYSRDYLSKDEYNSLSTVERNQLALDRYVNSCKKTKWQIGRDYELFIGYCYEQKGYSVRYFGSEMKLEDLGRDLICRKGMSVVIVQCKYWSSLKEIHEKHIMQLYGTLVSYCVERDIDPQSGRVRGVLVTNIELSKTAKKIADYLGIEVEENVMMKNYPRIKCNIGRGEFGETKIYHLPFDQQYDAVKIDKDGEFMAMTVAEAEQAGYRRAFKWHAEK